MASASGEVKFFNIDKGFGFIIQDNGNPDVFVHGSDVTGNGLSEGDKVQFNIEVRKDGRSRAVDVTGGSREGGWGDRNNGYQQQQRGGFRGYNEGGYGGRNNNYQNDGQCYEANDRGNRGGRGRNLCFSWRDTGSCRFGDDCKFSHDMN